ncbi:arginine repressor [Leuconostoc fallax]|uniref:arginine repressor n=1 Tax=Leuconostoc fallax TaxID=1251 RepID=UPI0005256689|nr:arginine repressor [Leuconostoc fallax]MBU7455758.1 arginine repressor [Leuconostoc fallax]
MLTKSERQQLILQLIDEQSIGSQEELLTALIEKGYKTTQTTISRDIRALNIVRSKDSLGNLRYQVLRQSDVETPDVIETEAIETAISEYAVKMTHIQFMIVIKTTDSSGNVLAGVLDDAHLPEIVGTLAGFDTIYVTSHDEQEAKTLYNKWLPYLAQHE